MDKIAVLTINDNNNYGNRLQSYAVQISLKKYSNYEVENIKNIIETQVFKKYIKKIIKRILAICNFKNFKIIQNRSESFKKFNKNIKFSKYTVRNVKISEKIIKKYAYFFTGSDQVWNPTFNRMSDIDFLTFAPKEKRNSFSASFGINEIPENLKEYYKEKLNGLNNISVREERGKELVKELTGRTDVEVLIDPTMMLTAEEWDKVAKKPKQLKCKKYILNYFLGELSKKRKKEIDRIAKENNCEVINLLDKNNDFYATGPSEFLYLEKNAFLICTDSFHSCVFAILYNTPFVVFDREDKAVNMNSRIETLLDKFELKDRKYDKKITEELLKCDYENTYNILEIEKKKTIKFIENCIN